MSYTALCPAQWSATALWSSEHCTPLHLAYAIEMKSLQLHDSIVMASPWDTISSYITLHYNWGWSMSGSCVAAGIYGSGRDGNRWMALSLIHLRQLSLLKSTPAEVDYPSCIVAELILIVRKPGIIHAVDPCETGLDQRKQIRLNFMNESILNTWI